MGLVFGLGQTLERVFLVFGLGRTPEKPIFSLTATPQFSYANFVLKRI
jgi:hypothetical protein